MMPSGIAGQFPSGMSQDLPTDAASSSGALDFVLLLERALGNGVAAQMSTGTVPEDLIDMNDAPAGEERPAVGQRSSSVSDEHHQAEPGVDAALAVLLAALNVPLQATSIEQPAISSQRSATSDQRSACSDHPSSLTPQQSANNSEMSVRSLQPTAFSLQPSDPSLQPAAFSLPPTLAPSGVPLTPQLADIIPKALPIDVSLPIVQQIAPLPQSSPTVFPHRFELLEGNSVNTKPGLPEDGATSGSAPKGVRLTPTVQVSIVSQEVAETSIMTQGPLLSPHESHQTLEPATAKLTLTPLATNEPSAFSLQPSASGDQQSAVGNQRSVGGEVRLFVAGAEETQNGLSQASGDLHTRRMGGLLQMVTPEESPVRPAAAPAGRITDQVLLPRDSAVSTATPSDPTVRIGAALLDGEGFPKRVQAEQSGSERATIRLEPTNSETAQVASRDRLASDLENERRSFDHSSSSHDDWRHLGRDRVIGPPPTGEEFRSESAAPPRHPGSLIDQVAEQLATAARLSLRNEGSRVQLRLHPQALGELTIEVSWQDSGIVASIKAQNSVAGDLLASDLSRLRTILTEQGVPVSHLGVQVGMDFRHWSFEGHRFQPSPAAEYAPEAVIRRGGESAVPMALPMKSNSLIDIVI